MKIVHEGRGGYVEIDDARYPIEHVGEGRFSIHFSTRRRGAVRAAHLRALEELVASEPARWTIERR
jgi:hypothetical protein